MSKSTLKTLAAGALLATTIFSGSAADAADKGKHYVALTGEYIIDANTDGNIAASIGSAGTSSSYKDGTGGIAAVGYYITDNVRTELEAAYRKLNGDTTSITIAGTKYTVDSSNIDAKAFSAMANIYYNFLTGSKVSPYIGIGTGWAREQRNGANALAYQTMVGADYKISNNSTVFAGYRYFATTDFENSYNVTGLGIVTEKGSVRAHAVDIGYRFSF